MCYIYSAFSFDKFKYITELLKRVKYCYFLIGSSGNGKNVLMRKIGEYFSGSTYFFCSYDSSSLDGVLVKDKVLIFDSVYPHNILPTLYKVNGEIVDLGSSVKLKDSENEKLTRLFNEEKIAKNEYLILGKLLRGYISETLDYFDNINVSSNKKIVEEIAKEVISNTKEGGTENYYFRSEPLNNNTKISFESNNILLSKYLVTYLSKLLEKEKVCQKVYHNIYNDKLVDSIETGCYYIGSNLICGQNINFCGENIVNAVDYLALTKQIKKLNIKALSVHKKLEQAYKPFVNFDINDNITEQLISKIKMMI